MKKKKFEDVVRPIRSVTICPNNITFFSDEIEKHKLSDKTEKILTAIVLITVILTYVIL